ncbi:PIN domain-containing protein [Pleurotus pulmonarius]
MSAVPDVQRPSRKGKERDQANFDFAENFQDKLTAFRRNAAGPPRTKERQQMPPLQHSAPQPSPASPSKPSSSRSKPLNHSPPSPRKLHPAPQHHSSRSSPGEADPEDFSRLRISSPPNTRPSPTHRHAGASKLFNPDTDPIPMRRTAEPESISDATSSSYAPRREINGHSTAAQSSHHLRDGQSRQLFDHRKDDPVRFSVLSRPNGRPTPTPKSSGEYVSASSASSYAASTLSSSFTLSSDTTSGSSASALFDNRKLETQIKKDDVADDPNESNTRIMLQGKETTDEQFERERWRKQIADHKMLAEMMHNLLEISLAPTVPASLRNIPVKYNIIVRLWSYGFHKLLESLRRASFTSPLALEHLQDFIYYAYTFYTGLYEEQTLISFKSGWLEALGDLARYQMIVATMVQSNFGHGTLLTTDALSKVPADNADKEETSRLEDTHSDSDVRHQEPSVGVAAARLMEVEPEKERWRKIAQGWYGKGIADTPGNGRLHHHLGLLSREVEGEELRAVYHFVKSMTTLHPFLTSRETILPVWSITLQARRSLPEARAPDLFVLLHGMLFTNIELDNFQPTLARFLERLAIEGAEDKEWIMMAVVNIGAVLEYGKPGGVLKKAGAIGGKDLSGPTTRVMMTKDREHDKDRMDVDEVPSHPTPPSSEAEAEIVTPVVFSLALQLTFAMLSHVLRDPIRGDMPNPYLTVLLTFLATILKEEKALKILERNIPWAQLSKFFSGIPSRIMKKQQLDQVLTHGERWVMLTSKCAPLREDWCLRAMEWVGRRIFERGYWPKEDDRQAELELLEERLKDADGHIEDDTGREETLADDRWTRIARCAVGIANVVDGFTWMEGTRQWLVEGLLAQKVQRWQELDRIEREEEERRRIGRRWDDSMEIDDVPAYEESSDEDDDNDSQGVKALKARRKYLQSLIQATSQTTISPPRHPRPSKANKAADGRPPLSILPGYTILVVDTNILLSSLPLLTPIIESLRWTVVIPLPVIMELDGLATNVPPLGQAARDALEYVTSHIRSHSISLKVQTSKGNYLTSLNVRTEQVDFVDSMTGSLAERSMDDLILKTAIWQDEHWVDRTAMLKVELKDEDISAAVKVVLITLDRNLRLKARSRSLPAANEKELASIFSSAT